MLHDLSRLDLPGAGLGLRESPIFLQTHSIREEANPPRGTAPTDEYHWIRARGSLFIWAIRPSTRRLPAQQVRRPTKGRPKIESRTEQESRSKNWQSWWLMPKLPQSVAATRAF